MENLCYGVLLISSFLACANLTSMPRSPVVPEFRPPVLALDNRNNPIPEHAVYFPDSIEYFNKLEEKRRAQYEYDNNKDSITVQASESHQQPIVQSIVAQKKPVYLESRRPDTPQLIGVNKPTETQTNQQHGVNKNSELPPKPSNVIPNPPQGSSFSPIGFNVQNQDLPHIMNADGGFNTNHGDTIMSVDASKPVHVDPTSASLTGFGLDIMKSIDPSKSVNTAVSPYSIALILAVLQQGAEGESQIEISRALRLNHVMSRELFSRLSSNIKSRSSRNILKIATSIFFNNHFDINRQYKNDAVRYFSSDMTPTNFKNAVMAARNINDWVSKGTQGKIPHLVAPDLFSDDTQMVLANAIFFKGLWNHTFNSDRTISRSFNLQDGGIRAADFMHQTGVYTCGHDRELQADFLVLPFEGLQYSLMFIVPPLNTGVDSLIRHISHGDFLRLLSSPPREVVVSIPKFNIRTDTDLRTPLVALGIKKIFTENSGLTALANPSGDPPRVTSALHTAVMSIDESGGSAAAATVLAVSTLSIDINDLEFRFNADSPFLAVLWDNDLNVPLFLAKIVDPMLK